MYNVLVETVNNFNDFFPHRMNDDICIVLCLIFITKTNHFVTPFLIVLKRQVK